MRSSVTDIDLLSSSEGRVRLRRHSSSSSDPHHRVLPRMYLQYRLLPTSLGSLACTRSAVRGPLADDVRESLLLRWRAWSGVHGRHVRSLVLPVNCYPHRHGRFVCLLARPSSALGKSPFPFIFFKMEAVERLSVVLYLHRSKPTPSTTRVPVLHSHL